MVDYWLDSDALIRAKRDGYGFDLAPSFWEFIERKVDEGVMRSPAAVYPELRDGKDELAEWAKKMEHILFVDPDQEVQKKYGVIADYVQEHCRQPWGKEFLAGADAWLIAHASFSGGVIVTFEQPAGKSPVVKIPDIANVFDVKCVSVWRMARDTGLRL